MNTLFCRGLLLYLVFYVFLIFVIIGYLGYDFLDGLRLLCILDRYFLDILFQYYKVDLNFLPKECWSLCKQENSKKNYKYKNLC